MPRIDGTTNEQSSFLRSFLQNPTGPAPGDWPTPANLRRWLRKPRFRAALESIQSTLRFQADFMLSSAAALALRTLDLLNPSPDQARHTINLLRLSHLRQRFTAASTDSEPPKSPRDHMLSIPVHQRLTDEEFQTLALRRQYSPPLQAIKQFPAPAPQDSFYYQLLQDPSALLWWIKLYNYHSTDKRYEKILHLCRDVVPHHAPAILPFFPDMPHQDPDVLDGSWWKR